jgi:hypothetical protein
MITLRQAAGLLAAALVSAAAAHAELRGSPNPTFTPEEVALIGRDPRLVRLVRVCPVQMRRGLDAWHEIRRGGAAPKEPVVCRLATDADVGRGSDEAALDILTILKEAAGQGTNR